MSMRFYLKELISQKLYLANGAPVTFIDVGSDTGILKTDNEYLINQLDSAVARSIGGLVPLTEEQYDEYSKKNSGQESLSNLVKDRWSLSQQALAAGLRSHLGAVAVGAPSGLTNTSPVGFDVPKEQPPALKVETEFSKPTVKRAYRKRGTVE